MIWGQGLFFAGKSRGGVIRETLLGLRDSPMMGFGSVCGLLLRFSLGSTGFVEMERKLADVLAHEATTFVNLSKTCSF